MRERLAVARARSNYHVLGAEAFADPPGVLLLRGIDNGDYDCLRRAIAVMARQLAKRSHFEMPRAVGVVWEVLAFLIDQRCPACHGRQFIQPESSIKACPGCNARGLLGQTPVDWGGNQRRTLYAAQAAMGRALATARASLATNPA